MSIHTQRKINSICSEAAYEWLQNWINEQHPGAYPGTPLNYFYRNTAHREYKSRFLESVILKVCNAKGGRARKPADKGRSIDTSRIVINVLGQQKKIGGRVFVKNNDVRVGSADIEWIYNSKVVNWEVKIGSDKQSTAQIAEELRAIKNKELYFLVKTVDEFIEIYLDRF